MYILPEIHNRESEWFYLLSNFGFLCFHAVALVNEGGWMYIEGCLP